jgi:hypothetical protein
MCSGRTNGWLACILSFVNVQGNVRVGRGARFAVLAYVEQSEIGGNIEANNCKSVLLAGNVTVGGNLIIHGSFDCRSNAGPCLAWLGKVDEVLRTEEIEALAASAYRTLLTSWEHRPFQVRSEPYRKPQAPRRL